MQSRATAEASPYDAVLSRCDESCSGSQFWGRQFAAQGHEVRLLIPAQFAKPYAKGNNNDFNDALAIAEAANWTAIPSVPLKNKEQLELQAIHRVRQRLIGDRAPPSTKWGRCCMSKVLLLALRQGR